MNPTEIVIETAEYSPIPTSSFFLKDIGDNSNVTKLSSKEEYWTDELESLLAKWRARCEALSEIHDSSGYITKARHYRIALPVIIIPFLMTFISQTFGEGPDVNIVNGIMYMIISGLAGLQTFFAYGPLYEEHFGYSKRYTDIGSRIESELARKREFRISADEFVTKIKSQIEHLGDTSPELPMDCC